MGCNQSSPAAQKNRAIDQQLMKDAIRDKKKIKLLLLGAGESGKSTLFKQMRLLYSRSKEFSPSERTSFKAHIYKNILEDMQTMIVACNSHTKLVSIQSVQAAEKVMKWSKNDPISSDMATVLLLVWNDRGLQQSWENRGDIQVQDSLEYFMASIERLGAPGFEPVNQDILRSRVRTSGIVEDKFFIESAELEMYDVGGQRNERRKWIGAFDGVTCVIFVAAISEYNQVLYEDGSVNRQDEAISLFTEQLTSKVWFDTPFILFLNKTDLFREKLPKIPFRVDSGAEIRNLNFEGPHCDVSKEYYTDGSDEEFENCYISACNYLQSLYEGTKPEHYKSTIYTKFTNSTDSDNIKYIMSSCKDIILRGNLEKIGFLG